MALPKVLSTSCIEITVDASLEGQQIQNIFHYTPMPDGAAPELNATLADMLDEFHTWFADTILTQVVTQWTTFRYFARELSGTATRAHEDETTYKAVVVRQFQWYYPVVVNGDVEGDPLPTFNAVNFYFSTLQNGRYSRGAKRLAGLYKTAVEPSDGNKLTAAVWAAMKVVGNGMINQIPLLGGVEALSPCLFFRTAALSNPDDLTSLALYQRAWETCQPSQIITSQVSRKRSNRSGS